MAIQTHTLAESALGSYLDHKHQGKETIFFYTEGYVTLTIGDSTKFNYVTHLYTEEELAIIREIAYKERDKEIAELFPAFVEEYNRTDLT